MVEIIETPTPPAPLSNNNKKKRQPKQPDGPKRTRTRKRAVPLLAASATGNSKINIKLNIKRDLNDAAAATSGKITTARQRMSAANRVKEVLGKTSGLTGGGGGGGQGTGLDKLRNVSRLISTNQVHNLAEIDPHDLLDTINHVLNIAHEATVTFSNQRESISGTMRRMLLELYNTRYDMTLVHAREHAGVSVHVAVAHNTFQSPTTFRPAFSALVADNPFQGRKVDNVHYQRRKKPAAAPATDAASSLSTSTSVPLSV